MGPQVLTNDQVTKRVHERKRAFKGIVTEAEANRLARIGIKVGERA